MVSENILESEGKNILVVRTGQKDSDSLMVTFSAEFDEDFLIDSEEKIELLVKKAREMKEDASEMKKELLELKIEAIEFQDKEGALFKDNETGESLEKAAEEIVSGLWVSKDSGPKKHKVIQIKKLKADKEQKVLKNRKKKTKVSKDQKMIVVKGAANSWTAEGKNQPLIVMDGKIMEKGKNLNEIDPDGIGSINVLKGKSAQEKYGDKGVNGVIEVVTKKE